MILRLEAIMLFLLSQVLAGDWAKQPVDPRYETDFTAFTLSPGRVRLGLVNLDVGVFHNFDLGTTPVLFLLSAPNIHGKVTMIEEGDFAMSLQSAIVYFGPKTFPVSAVSYPLELKATWVVQPKWSLHAGLRVENIEATGIFGLEDLAGLLQPVLGTDLTGNLQSAVSDSGSLFGGAHLTLLQSRFATDVRLNRRDSIIYQYQGYFHLNARIDAGYQNEAGDLSVGASAKLSEFLGKNAIGTHSLSWQFSWEHNVLRLGIGIPSGGGAVPFQALTQAIEFYHLFGKAPA